MGFRFFSFLSLLFFMGVGPGFWAHRTLVVEIFSRIVFLLLVIDYIESWVCENLGEGTDWGA